MKMKLANSIREAVAEAIDCNALSVHRFIIGDPIADYCNYMERRFR